MALLAALGSLGGLPAQAGPRGAETHWPLPPGQLEHVLSREAFEIRSVSADVGGVMGVRKLGIHVPKLGRDLDVKWKRAPDGDADGWNNTPRKEIAAYEIQKWFLDPEDYLVPTIVARCLPLELYEQVEANAKPNLPGTRCVMGVLVIWIENVGIDDPIYEEARFREDERYARHIANMNILTYLIEHEDGRRNNFLTADDKSDRRIFSIDNGVSFGAKVKNWFVWNWNVIRVPALREEAVARLRRVTPERVQQLGVVSEQRAGDDGVLRPVEPSENADPGRGSRVREGWIQLGLTRGEIEDLQERLDRLLERIDAGEQPLF
ncbi:MAG: hypothetical protein QNK04_03665 [Myxococcota bacterium]|nr:hypothetical protein [Myxococcota bacterium]